jgi:hypothetical protein
MFSKGPIKYIALAIATVLVILLVMTARGDNPQVKPVYHRVTDTFHGWKPPVCTDPVRFKLGSHLLYIPRTFVSIGSMHREQMASYKKFSWRTFSNDTVSYHAFAELHCVQPAMDEIVDFSGDLTRDFTGKDFSLSVSARLLKDKDDDPYLRVKKMLDRSKIDLKKLPVKDGFYVWRSENLYISKSQLSPNGYPVIFGCDWFETCATGVWRNGIALDVGTILPRNIPVKEWAKLYRKIEKLRDDIEKPPEKHAPPQLQPPTVPH